MTLQVFKEVGGSRILVAPADRFPKEFDRSRWQKDAAGYADNALAAQVRRDGLAFGPLVGDNRT